jgi:L-ascorbate metabolism protein UlaG (beta-lactamase superfamily)
MDVTWLGHATARLRGRDGVVLMDPCDKRTGYTLGRQTADIVTCSRPDPDHHATESITGSYRLLDAPGEYEIGGVLIKGIQTGGRAKKAGDQALASNVAFVVEIDDLRVCHLGDLDHTPAQSLLDELSDIDVLLAPVGGHGALDAAGAAEVVSLLQPRLVVPIRYRTEASVAELDPLDAFFKQLGRGMPDPQARLSVTRTSLPEDTQVAVLDYRR